MNFRSRLLLIAGFSLALLSVVVFGSYHFTTRQIDETTLAHAKAQAVAAIEKDLLYRRWAAGHGGLYAPVTPGTPPNPFLAGVPERDVETPSGRKLTLINPAYMTRQVFELAGEQGGVKGHITSLKPIRPENSPDPWEAKVLRTFEAGETSASGIEDIGGVRSLRYMRRLITEERCVSCHALQGYVTGDVRGGLSVSVPMAQFEEASAGWERSAQLIHFAFWFSGVTVILIITALIDRRERSRVREEEVARQRETQLLDAQRMAKMGSWQLDIPENRLFWSDEVFRIFEIDRNSSGVSYEAFLNAIHPEDRDRVNRAYTSSLENHLPYKIEHRLLFPDGRIKYVREQCETAFDEEGRPLRSLGTVQDVTEKKAEEEKALRLAAAVEHSADAIIIADENNNFTYMNDSATRIIGYRLEELPPPEDRTKLFSTETSRETIRSLNRCIGKRIPWSGRLALRAKDGTGRLCDFTATPVLGQDGKVISWVYTGKDITAQVEMERRAAQAERLEAIGTLAGGIAHDFNNILSAIIGYTELAVNRNRDPELLEDLESVLKASGRATELVRQILTFSRVSQKEAEPVKVKSVVKEALKLLRATIPTTVEMRLDIESEAMVIADPGEIHRILVNLCTNASLAMREDGGILDVSLKDIPVDHEIIARHPELQPGRAVCLRVKDTGIGMNEAVLARIFDPFFTSRKEGEGTGMGLSVVHGIVRARGGVIEVESAPGRGSEFIIYLPALLATEPSGESCDAELHVGTERIIFVDDEAMVAKLMEKSLSRLGYGVAAFTDSQAALDAFLKNPAGYDLIITDMTMPVMTGAKLTTELRRARPDIPVILCTGFSETMDSAQAEKLGIDAFLIKPVALAQLSAVIREVLTRRAGGGS